MKTTFRFNSSSSGGRVALIQRGLFRENSIAVGDWHKVDAPQQSIVRLLLGLEEAGLASRGETDLSVSSEGLFNLASSVLKQIGLPEVANIVLRLELVDRVETPAGHIKVRWEDALSRQINPDIHGIVVETADGKGRLTRSMWQMLRSIQAYNDTIGQNERIPSWLKVQQSLAELTNENIKAEQLLKNFRIFQAGAFGLDIREALGGPRFDPVLMGISKRRNPIDDVPDAADDGEETDKNELGDNEKDRLLPDHLQRSFASAFGESSQPIRSSYVLQPSTYLVIEPDLMAALDVVKHMQRSDEKVRRAFLKNPRTYLAQAMPDQGEVAGTLFVETQQYSDRVQGLGLWQKPKLDWLQRKSSGWLPEGFVLRIGGKDVKVDESAITELAQAASDASATGSPTVTFKNQQYPVADVNTALDALSDQFGPETELDGDDSAEVQRKPQRDPLVLIIKDGIEQVEDAAGMIPRRQEIPLVFPSDHVVTVPKAHQQGGFRWLVQAWTAGMPGVLLADDMGLGKTLQALAFLAWFRANRNEIKSSTKPFQGPILIVAPTSLLRNWQKEADVHLSGNVLGECVAAFGPGLRLLKTPVTQNWSPEEALDHARLREADWILTTYETLATYHRSFARISYSIAIFDEMQKIKAPDTINTHSAKTINANFVLGLTGTPIENRLEDLWCIMDRISFGCLGSMRDFSKLYGGEDPEALKELKAILDQPVPKQRPPIMLRRMKAVHLDGLPDRDFKQYEADMPTPQADAYNTVVRAAKQSRGNKIAMLKTIHDLRGISLHPFGGDEIDVTNPKARREWIGASARVQEAISILSAIKEKGEKALVFIEDRAVQATFAKVIAEEFAFLEPVSIINGSLDGDRRQDVVDKFQTSKPGFGVLVLSPKAAGIGLTITAANHVIHLSRWWNPAVEDQCNDRVYRIGQQKPVTVHIPIARHPEFKENSFDNKLNTLLERKRALSRDMLVPPIWEGDIDDLFSATIG